LRIKVIKKRKKKAFILKTLNIIGAGRVGRSLAHLWHKSGVFAVQDVLTRSQTSADEAVQFIGAGHAVIDMAAMRPADVWMLAVPDGQFKNVAEKLSNTLIDSVFIATDAIIFHCSGALSSAELQSLRDKGSQVASAHCMLSFSSSASAITQFVGTPCALEGDAAAVQTLQPAFESIGANCFDLAAKDKMLYHAAAVFASNFLPVLQVVAADLWQSTGVPKALLAPMHAALLNKAMQNLTTLGAAQALTGPAARGDTELVAVQGAAVAQWNAQAGVAYAALSQLASRIAKHGTIQNEMTSQISANTPNT
jgi:predicted short-subunit dehydrogenase-like oxidoreductase (DUF2520 family)